MNARNVILAQKRAYAGLLPIDCIKALYQGVFGCGHMVSAAGLKRLADEIASMGDGPARVPITEPIGDTYSRAHLRPLTAMGLKPATLFRLFELSSDSAKGSTADFEEALSTLVNMCENGELSFAADEVRREAARLKSLGYPAVSHSDAFRGLYSPAYRVILTRYAKLIRLFCDIDRAPCPKIIAIDGRCASGKTTLAQMLRTVYDCDVFHMDDFFLTQDMRTPQRLCVPGENVDHERFLAQVLKPLKNGERFSYRPYDCHSGTLKPEITVEPQSIAVVEGAYSLHSELIGYYGVKVFMSDGEKTRLERIEKRDGPAMLKRFESEWIPMEEAYFAASGTAAKCDSLVIDQEAII